MLKIRLLCLTPAVMSRCNMADDPSLNSAADTAAAVPHIVEAVASQAVALLAASQRTEHVVQHVEIQPVDPGQPGTVVAPQAGVVIHRLTVAMAVSSDSVCLAPWAKDPRL